MQEKKLNQAIGFFDTVNTAIMKIVHLLMYFAPIGVFALIASKLGAAGGGDLFLVELAKIGKYAWTVILALLLHGESRKNRIYYADIFYVYHWYCR